MNITIVGGGNVGTQFAVHCSQSNNVIIYTSSPKDFVDNIKTINEKDEILLEGKNIKATDDANTAFLEADLIFITYPAFAMNKVASIIKAYVRKNLIIGLIPGTGGGECVFKECIDNGAIVFGMQRVPSVARVVEKGKIVRTVGYRNELNVCSMPNLYSLDIAKIIENIFCIKTNVLPNYLCLTLTPSNPILHTSRLKTIFKDYHNGCTYDKLPLFYEGWDNESSELLFKCDNELQQICSSIKEFDLSNVVSLRKHYESETPNALTKKIRSIDGFKGLKTPFVTTEDGKLIPDFKSRYFEADFPYGLSILIQIAKFAKVDVPNLELIMEWFNNLGLDYDEFDYKKYGIDSYEKFVEFYSK